MRRAARVDANQPEVVKALKAAGMTVCDMSALGSGVPDLLVGWRGINVLIEVKDGAKKPSDQALTAPQKTWHETWAGQIHIARSPEEAVMIVLQHMEARNEAT